MSDIPRPDPRAALLLRAAEGDRQATRQLVVALTPVIRNSVVSVLSRAGSTGRRAARQEVEDATQTVLLALFADRARALLQWNPERGLALDKFVALLAKRETVSVMRSRRRNPWTEDPTLHEDLDRNENPRSGPESETISRDMLENLAVVARSRLTEKGFELFEMMFINGLPPEEVCALTGLSSEAVYAWKSRLGRQVKEIVTELGRGPSSKPPPLDETNPGLRDPSLETMLRLRRPPTESGTSTKPITGTLPRTPRANTDEALSANATRRRGGAA